MLRLLAIRQITLSWQSISGMVHFSYNQFYALVDGVDEFIGGVLTRRKYCNLLGDIFHYRRIKKEYKDNPTIAIMAIIILHYQHDDVIIEVVPKVTIRINRGTSLESILATIKSSISWQNRRWRQ